MLAFCCVWMQDTASGWLMTELGAPPSIIALLQASTSLPIFLLALPGGVIGDAFDRRTALIWVHGLLAVNALILAAAVFSGAVTPWLLLACNAVAGCCLAVAAPIRHAITPMLVRREILIGAVTWNSMGFNAARLIGPAIAGIVIALTSTAHPYLINAVMFVLVGIALAAWRNAPRSGSGTLRSSVLQSAAAAIRFAYRDESIRSILIKIILFSVLGGAVYSLLPVIMRLHLGANETSFGFGMMALGAGAIGGGMMLNMLRRHLRMDQIQFLAAALVSLGLVVIGLTTYLPIGLIGLFSAGCGWIMTLSSLNAWMQMAVHDSMRARVTSLALMSNALGLAVSSPFWGLLVEASGVSVALFVSAALLGLSSLVRLPLERPDVTAE